MRKWNSLLLTLFSLACINLTGQEYSETFADFYVSPRGSDAWTGKLSEPNADKTDGPFASLERARQEVKYFKLGLFRDVFVMIRGGEYKLSETVCFDGGDGHYDSYKVYYMNYPEEVPVFHSDIEVSGWKKAGKIEGLPKEAKGKVYVAPMPGLPAGKERFYTLYDNGKLMTRAHSRGFIPTGKYSGLVGGGSYWKEMVEADRTLLNFPEGALKEWPNLEDIEIHIQPSKGYASNYLTLASVNEATNEAHTTIPAVYPMGKISNHLKSIHGGSFCVENVIDYLDKPGEWVVNTQKGLVYYWPETGTPGKVTVPGLIQYILVDGQERGEIVRNISFKGLTFTRADREVVNREDVGIQHEWDMWNKANAMLRFRSVEYCEVDACHFTNSGSAAVRFDLHAQSNVIRNNLINHIGGTGILLCGYGPGKLDVNKSNRILNNHLYHCGIYYHHSPGIWAWQSGENLIRNNKLHDLPYDAIVLSGARQIFFNIDRENREVEGSLRRNEIDLAAQQFGELDTREKMLEHYSTFVPYSLVRNNTVEDNEIFDVVNVNFDGNAIYLSDVGFGNIIRRNYIHHMHGKGMVQAIRTDWAIKHTTISENIIYNCNGGGINTKFYENNVYNNIIADIHDIEWETASGKSSMFIGYVALSGVFTRSEMPPHTKLDVKHNIFYKTTVDQPFYRKWKVNDKLMEANLEECEIDQNLYFSVHAEDKGKSYLDSYQKRGVDANSIVADPLFMDIENGDFRLKKESPAYKIGFKDIDMSRIGLSDQFPRRFTEIVKKELGDNYDDFKTLEER